MRGYSEWAFARKSVHAVADCVLRSSAATSGTWPRALAPQAKKAATIPLLAPCPASSPN